MHADHRRRLWAGTGRRQLLRLLLLLLLLRLLQLCLLLCLLLTLLGVRADDSQMMIKHLDGALQLANHHLHSRQIKDVLGWVRCQ